MERFIKRSKTTPIQITHQSSTNETTNGSLSKGCGKVPNAVTQSMDWTLSSSEDISVEDITKYVSPSFFSFLLTQSCKLLKSDYKVLRYFADHTWLLGAAWVGLFVQTETSIGVCVESPSPNYSRNLSSPQVDLLLW